MAPPMASLATNCEQTSALPSRLSKPRVLAWARNSAYSLLDQGLLAVGGFGINVVLARWLAAPVYGAFAVVFAAYLWISGFQNVLVLEPLSVLGPSCHRDRLRNYFCMQMLVHFAVVGVLALLLLIAAAVTRAFVVQSSLPAALAAGAIALPFLLFAWLARRMCYAARRPQVAAFGSALYLAVLALAIAALRMAAVVTPAHVFLSMGLASLVGSLAVLARLFSTLGSSQAPFPGFLATCAENWRYGRWLLGSAILFAATSQFQTVAAAGMLGLGAAGILRAMQVPSLVMTQVVTATGLLALPSLSYDFGRQRACSFRNKAAIVSWGLVLVSAVFALTLALASRAVEHLLYSGKYADFRAIMPALALIPVFTGLTAGYSAALRASQKPQYDLLSNAITAPIAVLGTLLLIRLWGLQGAALSMIFSFAVLSVVTYSCFRYFFRSQRGSAPTEVPVSYSSIAFVNTLQQIARSDAVSLVPGLTRHLRWQLRKLLRQFPCRINISRSQIHTDRPCGVSALANAMGEYDYNNMRFLNWLLARQGGAFVDVGANIGSYTLVASEVERATVIGVEPHPRAFAALTRNIQLNHRRNVVAVHAAVSDVDGELRLSDLPDCSLNYVVSSPSSRSTLAVRSCRLDSLCRGLGNELVAVKIDVEGHELPVLQGFGALSPRVVFVEGGQRAEIRWWMHCAGYDGPFFVHYKRGELSPYPQRRPEDAVYLHREGMGWLSDLGFEVISEIRDRRFSTHRLEKVRDPLKGWSVEAD